MKINNLTNGLVAALLMASPIAGAETEYPAADFKPKVIYQDADYSKNKSAPAAAPVTESAQQEKSAEVDSNYPAANFEPKVLYKDTEYKPSKETASTSQRASGTSESNEVAVNGTEKAPEESMLSYLLGLVVFAVAGFVFLGKRAPKAKVSDAPVYSAHVSGLSGVARYMRKHNMAAVTGVARYLESHVVPEKEATTAAAVSGVEKYLEKKAVSDKEKAAEARTGVEKYMRNRG